MTGKLLEHWYERPWWIWCSTFWHWHRYGWIYNHIGLSESVLNTIWQGRLKAGLVYLVWSGLVELVENVELVKLVELDELVELVWIWSECFVDGLARSIESLESSLGGKMLDPTVAWLPTLPLLPLLLPIQMSNFLTFVSFLLVGSLRFVVVWGYMLLKGERERVESIPV